MSRKVTDDTALTGANLATGDLFDVVDISDTTDDATGTNKKMTAAETVKGLGLLGGNRLITTAVKTTTYTAAVGDHVPCDATSASFTVTLPTAPADGAEIAVQLVATASAHNVTVACGGSDVLDVASGATSMVLDSSLLFHTVRYHYNASGAIWYRISNYVRLANRGSLFTRNANGLAELALGANGTFAGSNGTDLVFAQPPYVWQYDAGATAWSNDSTQKSMIASTKTFPTMAVGDQLVCEGAVDWLNNSGATQALTFAVKNGTTTLASALTGTQVSSANPHHIVYRVVFVCVAVGNSSTGTVMVSVSLLTSAATVGAVFDTLAATNMAFVGGTQVACATDGSGGALDFQFKMSTATATSTTTPRGLSAVYLPKLV